MKINKEAYKQYKKHGLKCFYSAGYVNSGGIVSNHPLFSKGVRRTPVASSWSDADRSFIRCLIHRDQVHFSEAYKELRKELRAVWHKAAQRFLSGSSYPVVSVIIGDTEYKADTETGRVDVRIADEFYPFAIRKAQINARPDMHGQIGQQMLDEFLAQK